MFETTYTYEDLTNILEDRVTAFKKKYQQDAKILNAIAKYPPAFGLLGATTGMIAMMTNLGGPGGTTAIGQSMAVALIATFWGIATANFIFLPLSDNAQKAYVSDEFTRNFIKEGILLIKKDTAQKVFIERLSSMLPLEERVEAKTSTATVSISSIQSNIIQIFSKTKSSIESNAQAKNDLENNQAMRSSQVTNNSPNKDILNFKEATLKKKIK